MPADLNRAEMLLYPRIRKSPYFHAARKHGVAMYSVYNRMYVPRHYGDPVAEYWNLLTNVDLADVGVERAIEITGPDAFTFTNRMVTRDLSKCAVGQCKYTFITDESGGIINDPVLLRLGENHFWLTLADSDGLLWAKGLAVNSGLDVTLSEPDMGPIQVQGPKSLDVMVALLGESIRDIAYYHLAEFTLDAMRVLVSRTGYTAELGYELYLVDASKHGSELWSAWSRPAFLGASTSVASATSVASRPASSPTAPMPTSRRILTRWAWAIPGWSAWTRTVGSSATRPCAGSKTRAPLGASSGSPSMARGLARTTTGACSSRIRCSTAATSSDT